MSIPNMSVVIIAENHSSAKFMRFRDNSIMQKPGRRAACKHRIAQQSHIQAAATLQVAWFGYLAITAVPGTLRHWLCEALTHNSSQAIRRLASLNSELSHIQAAATLQVAWFGYLAITAVPGTLRHWLCEALTHNSSQAIRRLASLNSELSHIQAAATLQVAWFGYLAITAVPGTLRHWLCEALTHNSSQAIRRLASLNSELSHIQAAATLHVAWFGYLAITAVPGTLRHWLCEALTHNSSQAIRRLASLNSELSHIQAAATLQVAWFGYLAITAVPGTLRHWLCEALTHNSSQAIRRSASLHSELPHILEAKCH
ncbi:hypothetical protein J6590_045310 [Homalodisca vitripennis]|nr:hypothetical protein J6590_045310 [Homalodisca vitripennis]